MPEYQEFEHIEPRERTIGHLDLENGLSVYFIDRSTPPVVGRCRVELLIRVPVEPAEDHFNKYPTPSEALRRFVSLAGPGPVEFQAVKIRNFIVPAEVDKLLEKMKDDFIRLGLPYLKNPKFVSNFITRKYEDLLADAAVHSAHEAALRTEDERLAADD
ncbi:conserved hypothetical protein [Syntrophobacter sp. SbD1]|nr:conserved hypothetical protein [Syntrophobacter sp. SbD1]